MVFPMVSSEAIDGFSRNGIYHASTGYPNFIHFNLPSLMTK
jgi:hypothetical protein